ncbi:MAG: DUF4214 domain-containing protein [Acidimicrobiales bacterium]
MKEVLLSARNPQPVRRASVLIAALVLILASIGATSTGANAEVPDDVFGSTWGVRGLGPSQVSINYRVRSMVTIGDRVYVAGRFAEVVAPDGSTRDQSYLAAFNRETGDWISTFTPTVNGPIHALAVSSDGTTLFAGGEFTTVNGTATRGLVALSPATGAVKPGFAVNLDETNQGRAIVMAIEPIGNQLYVGGEWRQINGVAQARIARISQQTGAIDAAFSPTVLGGQVLALEVSSVDGRVYLGGQFSSVNGDAALRYFAAVDSSGVAVPQPLFDDPNLYRPTENINGYAILEVGDTVFVGARSNLLFVLDRKSLVRKWHYGPELNAFNIDKSWHASDFQALATFEGAVYAGNHVRWIGFPSSNIGNGITDSRTNIGAPANTLTRFTLGGEHDKGFLPVELKGSVWALADAGNGCLWAGGNFDIPGKSDWNLTRLCDQGPATPPLPFAPFGSSAKFIEQQYLDFYGRKPTTNEINFWLANGVSSPATAPTFVAGVVAGPALETDRQVVRLYTGLFGRLPDQGGLRYWTDLRHRGLSLEDMVDAFLVSPEFNNLVGAVDNRAFAAEVYRRVLDREPDAGGLNYWETVLRQGFPRRELVVHFTESEEFRTKSAADVGVIVSYSNMVERIPTASELALWSQRVATAKSALPLITMLYNSSEYANRVSLLPTGKI